jgi:hypothetical protein
VINCIGCGAEVPDIEYPAHADMRTSPGCWSLFSELLDREFSSPEYWPAHQLTVNAYALQHSASNPALHLIALCLRFDLGFSDDRILPVMRRASKAKESLPSVEAPSAPNTVTVLDVCKATDAKEHIAAVERWAKSVWDSWSESHGTIRALTARL